VRRHAPAPSKSAHDFSTIFPCPAHDFSLSSYDFRAHKFDSDGGSTKIVR